MASLSIKQIKQILEANGTGYSDCIEKADFVRKLNEVRSRAKQQKEAGRGSRRPRSYGGGGGARTGARPSSSSRPNSSAGATFNGVPNTADSEDIIKRILGSKLDYYTVLGVSRNADEKTIKKAYRKIALKLHPDKCKHPDAEQAFKIVAEAGSVLQDNEKRQDFDAFGADAGSSSGANRGFKGFRGGGAGANPDDILRAFFGGGGRGGGFPGGGGFRFHTGGPGAQFFFNQGFPGQQRRRRRNSDSDEEGRRGERKVDQSGIFGVLNALRSSPMFPLMFFIFIAFLGPLLMTLASKFVYVLPLLYVLPPGSRRYIFILIVMMALMG